MTMPPPDDFYHLLLNYVKGGLKHISTGHQIKLAKVQKHWYVFLLQKSSSCQIIFQNEGSGASGAAHR